MAPDSTPDSPEMGRPTPWPPSSRKMEGQSHRSLRSQRPAAPRRGLSSPQPLWPGRPSAHHQGSWCLWCAPPLRGPVSHGGEMGTETCHGAMGSLKNHEKPLGKHMPGAGTARFFKWSKVKSSNKVISPCQFGARRQTNLQQRLVAGYIFRIDVMSSITMYHSFLHYSCDCPPLVLKTQMAQEKWAWCLSSAHLRDALSSDTSDCPNPNSWSKSPLLLKSLFPSPNLLTPWCRPRHPPYSTMGTLPGLFEACNQPTKGQLTDGQGRHVRHDVPRSMRRVLELLCCEFSVHTVWNGNKNNPPLHRGSEIKDYSDLIHFFMSKGWESEDKNMDFWRV